jgi:hypothetical protein
VVGGRGWMERKKRRKKKKKKKKMGNDLVG